MSHRTSRDPWAARRTLLAMAAAASLAVCGTFAAADDEPAKPADAKPAELKPDDANKPNPKPGPATRPGDNGATGVDRPDNRRELLLPTTNPSTRPATAPTTKPALTVTPEVRAMLDGVRDAYRNLKSLRVAGTIVSDFDVNSQQLTGRAEFDGVFVAPLKFRHRLRELEPSERQPVVVGGTGKKFYVFDPQYNYYYLTDAPKDRGETKLLGAQIAPLLEQQNLSFLLASVADASAELLANIDKMEKVEDAVIDGAKFPALRITVKDYATITVAFDGKTNLVRRVVWDRKAYALARKQQDVKTMLTTMDYAKAEVDIDASGEDFAWAPPLGARDVTSLANAGSADDEDDAGGGGGGGPAAALVGQPAPDFALKTLDGTEVKLSDLKGSVVLLDFWATWCGPCRASLPHLDAIHKELGEKGLKSFAVNLREKPELVKAFVEKTKLGMPVLMDTDGKVAKSFKVSGIPQTVVVGKDGTVKAVVVGSGTHDKVKAAIVEALK